MKRAVPILLLLLGCRELQTYPEDTCGNNVVESGEDCDLIADAELGAGLACGPPDGSPRACRYLCSSTARCPPGWSCFGDGVCRFSSGRFTFEDDPRLIAGADEVALGDVLGDERLELVVRLDGDLGIHELPAESGEASPFGISFPAIRGEVALAEYGDAGRSAVFVPTSSRFADPNGVPRVDALIGSGDRLLSLASPRRALDVPIGAELRAVVPLALGRGGPEDLAFVVEAQRMITWTVEAPACPPASLSFPAPADAGAFARPSTRRDGDRLLVANAFAGASNVIVFAITSSAACPAFGALQDVAIEAPLDRAGVELVELDGSGGPELLAYVVGERVAVAVERAGAFGPAELRDEFSALDERHEDQSTECNGERFVLAAADLNGDRALDIVTEDGIFLARGASFERAFTRTRGDAWAEAIVADFDRDGRIDVVASTRSRSAECSAVDLELVRQLRDETFAAEPINGVTLPRLLRSGDVDADGIADVAVVEESRDGALTLAVLYGDTKEALEDKSAVGRFDQVSIFESFVSRDSPGLGPDVASDLLVVPGGERALSLIFGSPKRSMLAPIPLEAESRGNGVVPFAIAADRFSDPESDDPDLVALFGDRLTVIAGQDLRAGAPILNVPLELSGFRHTCAALLGLEAAGGGKLVAGVDGRFLRSPASLDTDPAPPCDFFGPPSQVFLSTLDAGTYGSRALASAGRGVVSAIAIDLDRSGDEDLVLHFAFEGTERRGRAVAVFNPRSSGSTLDFTELDLLPELDVLGVARLNVDGDDEPELIALTTGGLARLDWNDAEDRLAVGTEPFALPDLELDGALTKLLAGDLSGDGLDDLLLLYGDGIFVFAAEVAR